MSLRVSRSFWLALLPLALCCSDAGAEWSTAQTGAIERVEEYALAIISEDKPRIMGFFHEDFRSWNFAEPAPIDKSGIAGLVDDYSRDYTVLAFDVRPTAVQVLGDLAVVHVWYDELMRDAREVDSRYTGRWTITMVRDRDTWLFYSWSWLEDAAVIVPRSGR